MACDLETVFGDLAARVPTGPVGDVCFVLSARNVPIPAETLATNLLVIRRSQHEYNEVYRADGVTFQASRETYRQLGLLILAVLFHEQPAQVRLDLHHEASNIRHLVIEYEYRDAEFSGYQSRPHLLAYSPDDTDWHPWFYTPGGVCVEDLPTFFLTRVDERHDEEAWASRDVVRLCGSDRALANFAELLLNAGRADNPVLLYALEGEGGFRGVGIHSAEVWLCLPGSLGWAGLF